MVWVTGKSAGGDDDDDVLIVAAALSCNGILLVLRMLKTLEEDAEEPIQEEYRRCMERWAAIATAQLGLLHQIQ